VCCERPKWGAPLTAPQPSPSPGGMLEVVAQRWHTVPHLARLCRVELCNSQYLRACETTHNPKIAGSNPFKLHITQRNSHFI
jgi:hypothetical protein